MEALERNPRQLSKMIELLRRQATVEPSLTAWPLTYRLWKNQFDMGLTVTVRWMRMRLDRADVTLFGHGNPLIIYLGEG